MRHAAGQLSNRLHLLGLAQLLLQLQAIQKQTHLVRQNREHSQQLRVRLADSPAEELHHSHHLAPMPHRESNRPAQARPRDHRSALENRLLRRVAQPEWPPGLPHASGQAQAPSKRHLFAQRHEFSELGRRRMPDLDTAQDLGHLVHQPQFPDVPDEVFADDFEQAPRRFFQRG